ncbi:MAG: radical SAM protein [Candidatus Omnitrophica bacterium]|nr:radical SAM protein [Candidatus Omnitrophota bacterium]
MALKVYLGDLVHNVTAGGNVMSGNIDFTVPLNVGCIAANLKKELGGQVDVRLFKYASDLLAAVDRTPPAVLGVSNYAWNNDLNDQIGQYVKKYYPNVFIVMGGPAIRSTPGDIEQFLKARRWLDAYVMYEGEQPCLDLIRHVLDRGPVLEHAPGHPLRNIAYLANGQFYYAHVSITDLGDVNEFPSPYLTGLMDEFLEQQLIPLFETNRGCPFTCTFCDWGMAAMNKVRKFTTERVFGEFEYVATRFPNFPVWIFADANFGILPRDVDIARKIREVKERTALTRVMTFDSKNTHDRNTEISEILGRYEQVQQISNTGMAYMALQHLSPKVLSHIKRTNIKLGDIPKVVDRYHSNGVRVSTDILFGLPSETLEDAFECMRQVFRLKFDYINLNPILMLPGSEMETDASRERYALKTKFLIRRGSYGEYAGRHETIRAMEFDEVVCATDTFPENDLLTFYIIRWLVYFSWNHGRFAPLLKYLVSSDTINPIDALVSVMETTNVHIREFFDNLRRDLAAVMFETPQTMREHFYQEDNWNELLSYVKIELRYNALLYRDARLHHELCDVIGEAVRGVGDERVARELLTYLKENYVDLHAIANNEPCPEKRFTMVGEALSYINNKNLNGHALDSNKEYEVVLSQSAAEQSVTRDLLHKHGYTTDPINAIERLLGARYASANYTCHVAGAGTHVLVAS